MIMLALLIAIFVLHGLVHLLYAGQSLRLFELRSGMVWPDGSWVFSRMLSKQTTRRLAVVLLTLAALGFVAGGLELIVQRVWWYPVIMSAAALSTLLFILLWDGKLQALDEQGGIGVLIDGLILILGFMLGRPA